MFWWLLFLSIVLKAHPPLVENLTQADTLARHYLEIGEIKKAEELSAKVKDKFLLGEIAYFNHEFDTALEYYSQVSSDLWEANDALSRIIFIKSYKAGLDNYVTAELFGRKKQWEQGIKILEKLTALDTERTLKDSATFKESGITAPCLILLAQFLEQKGEFEEALKKYLYFIKEFKDEHLLPEVWLKLGDIYTKLERIKEAQKTYREILLKLPKSAVAPIARERLESL
ncbi:hypothetical protein KAW65_05240 [candidate division WOR-3 bacterium]|nr:hypothetical protein [candidate division WOR-3 bacterium]